MPQLKILVIEDDLFYQTYVKDLMSDLEVEIISAADGETGMALAVSEKPDLIITDIEIPRIQGFVLLRMIREHPETRETPVILMSGKVEKDLLERHSQLREHADGYLLKPFSGQALLDLVEKTLGIKTGSGPEREIKERDGGKVKGQRERIEKDVLDGRQEAPDTLTASDNSLRALVVDDSRYICDISGDFLKEIGFSVRFAMDGEEGLKEALDLIPDLVLLDVQMPKMNGFVVCEELRKEESTRDAVIILMSAVVDGESFQKHSKLRYHADAYLQKPFMKSELQDLVMRLIPRKDAARSGLEDKTGFLVPSEEDITGDHDLSSASGSEKSVSMEELIEARSTLESLKIDYEGLEEELKVIRAERDRLEDEVYELRSDKEGREEVLREKLAMLTQRFEESKSLIERFEEKDQEYAIFIKQKEAFKTEMEKKVTDLSSELERSESEKASLVSEADSLRNDLEEMRIKAKAHADTAESTADLEKKSEELERECKELRRDLSAAVSAKNEIEDQVKYLLEKRESRKPDESLEARIADLGEQNRQLYERVQEAESRVSSLSEMESKLLQTLEEKKALQAELEGEKARVSIEMEQRTGRIIELEAELDTFRKNKAGNEAEKEVLKDRIDAAESEMEVLQDQLEKARTRLTELEERAPSGDALEESLREERNLRVQAEAEADILKGRVEELSDIEDRFSQMERKRVEAERALDTSEKLRDELERRLSEVTAGTREQDGESAGNLSDRLGKLEAALSQTVLEAQSIIDQQSSREKQLEENMRTLMSSLQEDREAFREEKEQWRKREDELRTAFEDALEENRRIMGEETARLYPMLVPKRARTLEVVTGSRRYGLAAAIVLLLVAVMILGYMLFFRTGQKTRIDDSGGGIDSSGRPVNANGSAMPIPRVSLPANDSPYEVIWRRQTVHSVSDDMMIQATLHTLHELEAVIIYTADKEGWTGQRRENILSDMTQAYDFDHFYYVTVFTRNLREGRPGYAEDFQNHIALRDDTGRETKALVPEELEGSRFITSRVYAAEKEMNADYLYEVGRTISFAREDLVENPRELQLLIYDIGAVPMRVMTWDLSAAGS